LPRSSVEQKPRRPNVSSFHADRHVLERQVRDNPRATTRRIFFLGATRVIGSAGTDILPRAKKTKAIFAYLCLSQGEPLPRENLAEMFWNESPGTRGRDALRHALAELSHVDAGWKFERERNTVRIDTTGYWIDAFEIPDRPDRLLQDLFGVSPEFDRWLHGERARFEMRWRNVLGPKLDALIAQNAPAERRAAAARELLAVLPIHGGAIRGLMTALVDEGETADAIREFERHRLECESVAAPVSSKTLELYNTIRTSSVVQLGRPVSSGSSRIGAPASPTSQKHRPTEGVTDDGVPKRSGELSLAVLPFRNLSGGKHHDHVVQAVTEDLSEALGHVPGLFVVSRISASVFKKQDRPTQEIGAALGARYLISGYVRIIDGRARLGVELAEADSGLGLWADHFDEKIDHLLQLHSGLADAAVQAIAPEIRAAELRRLRIKRTADYSAYDYYLQAQEYMRSASRMVFESAKQLFDAALVRDPNYAAALAAEAHWHVLRIGQGWSIDPAVDTQRAEDLARRAIECNSREATAFAVQGHIAAYLRQDFDLAFSCFATALKIKPSSPRALLWNANTHSYLGEGASAVEKANRAMALSPYDPLMCAYAASSGLAHLANGQYFRAVEFALRAIRENPGYTSGYKVLVPALVLAGEEADASNRARQLLSLEPGLTVAKIRSRFPEAGDHPLRELLCEAMASAGIPRAD
jgi:TolB-like protein/DNA-binding SARP family transcriptional activator